MGPCGVENQILEVKIYLGSDFGPQRNYFDHNSLAVEYPLILFLLVCWDPQNCQKMTFGPNKWFLCEKKRLRLLWTKCQHNFQDFHFFPNFSIMLELSSKDFRLILYGFSYMCWNMFQTYLKHLSNIFLWKGIICFRWRETSFTHESQKRFSPEKRRKFITDSSFWVLKLSKCSLESSNDLPQLRENSCALARTKKVIKSQQNANFGQSDWNSAFIQFT